MSAKSNRARLEKILKYIEDIQNIVFRHGNLESALKDIEGQYAIMLCMIQIGEILNKIDNPVYAQKLPIKYAVAFRNILVHDYDSVHLQTVEKILEESLPDLKRKIEEIFATEI